MSLCIIDVLLHSRHFKHLLNKLAQNLRLYNKALATHTHREREREVLEQISKGCLTEQSNHKT